MLPLGIKRPSAGLVEWCIVLAIMGVAAYLRWAWPDVVEFKRDEANLSLLALDFARGHSFPLLGIGSSVGLPNAPWNVYVLAVPYLFTSSPLTATHFIGLLNIAAVGLVYVSARRFTGRGSAAFAALALAASPWSVIFSRKIWAQNMLPVFFLLTLGAGYWGFLQRHRTAQAAFFPLLAVTGQIHYGAFVILPAVVWLLWCGRKAWSRAMVLGVLVAGIVTLPYAIGAAQALRSAGGIEGLAKSSTESTAVGGLRLSDAALRGAGLMIAGAEIHSLAGPVAYLEYLATVPQVGAVFSVLPAAVLLAAAWLVARSARFQDARTPVDVLLLLWLGAPIILFSVSWTPFYIHYLIPVLPAAFLILGFGLHDLYMRLPEMGRAAGAVGVVLSGGVVFGLQAYVLIALLRFMAVNPTPDGFGTPLRYLMPARHALLTQALPVIGQVGGQAVIFDDEPTIWSALLYDVPSVRFVDSDTQVYPLNPAALLTKDCDAQDVVERFALRQGEGCYGIRRSAWNERSAQVQALAPFPVEMPHRFANGVEVLRYGWAASCLTVVWRIHAHAEQDYQFAVHFFDATDQRVQMADGLSWFARYWLPGDLVLRTFCLSEPDSTIEVVRLGMYRYDGQQFYNVDLLDDKGLPSPDGQMLVLRLGDG